MPTEINQANILLPLAPRLSARSDTFKIRAYGEVRDADDNIIAQATCEAVVQRLPEYVDPRRIRITTNLGMMIPRPLRSIPPTRPTADVLKSAASDGWIKAKYNFTFMSSLRSTLLLTCLATLISGSLTYAQEPADSSDSGEAKPYTGMAFTAIALSKIPYENLYYRNGTKFIEITWRNGRRSNPYPLSEAKALEVFIDHDDPKNPYRLVGKASLVPGTKKMLYFVGQNSSAKEGELPLKLYGIDDSESVFPDSSYRFINFASVPLVIDFNRKRFLVKPGKPTVQKLSLSKAGAFTPFVLRNTKGKVLGGTRLFSHATNREMVLIFPPKKGSKRMDIRFFSD